MSRKDRCSDKDKEKDKKKDKHCEPVERFAFGAIYDEKCDGSTHTLIEATVNPMKNVVAELENFGDCPVKFNFLTTKGETITKLVQPDDEMTFQIPGRILLVTVTCDPCNHDGQKWDDCRADAFLSYIQCICCKDDHKDDKHDKHDKHDNECDCC